MTDPTSSTSAGVQASNGNLDANVNVNGLTSTVLIIFALQLIFCLAICFYTHSQATKAQKREEEQKAQFYSFLYNFHKQMTEEEDMIAHL